MDKSLLEKKLLVIVESPTKSHNIQKYLKDAGYNAKVYASKGHIMKLADGGDYYNSGVSPDKNFELNLKVDDDHAKIVSTLKQEVKDADIVYLMADGDREGEVIAWSLVKFLKIPQKKIRRAVTHEITPSAVIHAIENPIELNENLVAAGLARMTLDKMMGWRLSPISKTYIGAKSVGRCQSVGLKLVVDREKEIQNFVPETYYTLEVRFKKGNSEFSAKYIGTKDKKIDKLDSLEQVKQIKAKCTKEYIIEDIQQKIREESPKSAFDTPTFQQEAANKLGLKVKDTMSIAQSLFENGYITYHRTASTELSDEFIKVAKVYIENNYSKDSYNGPRKAKSKQKESLDGHEALRITDISLTPDKFSEKDANILHGKVYKLIWQRTVASLFKNAKISETTYTIDNNGQKFVMISREIIDPGYRSIYVFADKEDTSTTKETFTKGEKLQIINPKEEN